MSLAIAMMATVAIFQLLVVADSRARSTASGADAQMSGSLAAYLLDRDLQQAAYGLGRIPSDFAGCELAVAPVTPASSGLAFRLHPVLITQGAGSQPDGVVAIMSSSQIVPIRVAYDSSTETSKRLRSRAGFMPPSAGRPGDVLVAMSGGASPRCALLQVSSLATDDFTILHESGPGAPWNAPGASGTGAEGFVLNLGPTPRVLEWSVDPVARELRMRNLLDPAGVARTVAEGVVDLQAEYGVEDPISGVRWVVAPSKTDWPRVSSIRFAVVVQGRQHERDEVTTVAPVWSAAGRSLEAVTAIPDWKHYRYRVYESTTSLRNVLWGR